MKIVCRRLSLSERDFKKLGAPIPPSLESKVFEAGLKGRKCAFLAILRHLGSFKAPILTIFGCFCALSAAS